MVHSNNSECLYLRILLHIVEGPLYFAQLRTLQRVALDTYQVT